MLSFIVVCFNIIFGGLILFKAVSSKDKYLYYFILVGLFSGTAWTHPIGIGYIYWLITTDFLNYYILVLIGLVSVPFATFAWLNIYLSLVLKKRRTLILTLYGILTVVFYIYIFSLLFTIPDLVAVYIDQINDPISLEYKGFALAFAVISVITNTLTGLHFAIKSMKVRENMLIKWKGRFLLIAFIIFTVVGILGSVFSVIIEVVIIVRILVVIALFFLYVGFIMPSFMKKLLKIED